MAIEVLDFRIWSTTEAAQQSSSTKRAMLNKDLAYAGPDCGTRTRMSLLGASLGLEVAVEAS